MVTWVDSGWVPSGPNGRIAPSYASSRTRPEVCGCRYYDENDASSRASRMVPTAVRTSRPGVARVIAGVSLVVVPVFTWVTESVTHRLLPHIGLVPRVAIAGVTIGVLVGVVTTVRERIQGRRARARKAKADLGYDDGAASWRN